MNPVTKSRFQKLIYALGRNLTGQQRLILSLYFTEDLNFQQIASHLNIPEREVWIDFVQANDTCVKVRQLKALTNG